MGRDPPKDTSGPEAYLRLSRWVRDADLVAVAPEGLLGLGGQPPQYLDVIGLPLIVTLFALVHRARTTTKVAPLFGHTLLLARRSSDRLERRSRGGSLAAGGRMRWRTED